MRACVFSADGKQIISSSSWGSIQVWDVAHAKEVRRIEVDAASSETYRLSPNGRFLSAMRIDWPKFSRLTIWDLTTGKKISQRPYPVEVHHRILRSSSVQDWAEAHAAFAPDGQSITGWYDQRLVIEDVHNGRVLALLPEKVGSPVAFSPDGHLVAAALKPKGNSSKQATMAGGDPRETELREDGS